MTDQGSNGKSQRSPTERFARRLLEMVAAAVFLVAIFYWPHTNGGRIVLIAAAVIVFVCASRLSKWPSI